MAEARTTTRATALGLESRVSRLENGLRVVTCAMPSARSVTVAVFIAVGGRYEAEAQAGVSHFLEHMAFKGTRRRPTPTAISAAIEGMGGELNAETDQEFTVYWAKVPGQHGAEALDLLLDMVRHPLMDPQEMEKERLVIVEEINMTEDYPGYRAELLLGQLMWPDHPLGRDVAGSRETVRSLGRQELLDHKERYYTPDKAVVCVAGPVKHRETVNLARELADDWEPGPPGTWEPFMGGDGGPVLRLEHRRVEQAHLAMGLRGLPVDDPDRYALDVLSAVLGEGMSSRLFTEVREKRGLAYDVRSSAAYYRDCGAFYITAGVDPRRLREAVKTIVGELGRARAGLSRQELERAQGMLTGRLLLGLEDTRSLALWVGRHLLLLRTLPDPAQLVHRIQQVSIEDLRQVASRVLVTQGLHAAVVGPLRSTRRLEALLRLE